MKLELLRNEIRIVPEDVHDATETLSNGTERHYWFVRVEIDE